MISQNILYLKRLFYLSNYIDYLQLLFFYKYGCISITIWRLIYFFED